MILRPYGLIIGGRLHQGLEVLMDGPTITQIRSHTGMPENYVLSPAFVNAHSHLEYRGLQDRVHAEEYWPWIREITELKRTQSEVRVRQETIAAAHENHKSGVALVAEHSDRPFAATAMLSARLDGVIFQETITFFERLSRREKIAQVRAKAAEQAKLWRRPVFLSPHAYQTVDRETLAEFGAGGEPISIHVAETPLESQFTRDGSGPIGDFYRQVGFEVAPTGKTVVGTLFDLGLVREGAQFVHCCDIDNREIAVLSERKVSVAHCPRSNTRLKCPPAPVREMLDAGIKVGLGLDSPASSGAIDMFAEMRAALRTSLERGKALLPEEVWSLATDGGAESLRFAIPEIPAWSIEVGHQVPMIQIHVPGAGSIEDVIEHGSPSKVSWIVI